MDWHNRKSGATYRSYAGGRPSSYEKLASFAHPDDRILDLACGDGSLLELLSARGARKLAGIDISQGELKAARAKLGSKANVVRGRAQAPPFADQSFDLVTCHLAFMLMSSVEIVTAEIRRILRIGGRFAAVIGGGSAEADDIWARLVQRLAKFSFQGPQIGNRKTRSEEGLRELLNGFKEVQVEKFVLDLSGTPDDIWALFLDTYNCDMMNEEDLGRLKQELYNDCRELLRPDGSVPCSMRMLVVSAISG